jgi:uncharacterized protein YbaP (TraB family)
MKRIVIAGIIAVFAVSFAAAQSSVWKVTNGKNTVYIGGSIHMLRKSDYPLPKAYDTAFSKSKILVFEVDMSSMKTAEFFTKLSDALHLPNGQTLKDVLNEETYALIEEKCLELKLPFAYIATLKPSMAMTVLENALIQKLGFAETGVDAYYDTKARKQRKALDSLETADFQLEMLMNMGNGYENEFVIYSLNDLENIENDMNELAVAWRSGDIAGFEESLAEMQKTPALYNDLVKMRNDVWIPRLKSYLETPKTEFVIVGAAHLYGPDGIITQLAASGYPVEQMK